MIQTEKYWQLPAQYNADQLPENILLPIAQVLLNRGLDTTEKLRFFLEPPHKLPYNPLRMSGMDVALQRLYQAIEKNEKVGIFGDFDVDGITGTAIVAEGLGNLGVPVVPYLPHRVGEGHGLSDDAVQKLVSDGVSLIVTVDCGVTSVKEVAGAGKSGVDVIITDHHTPAAPLPDAVAIINPRLSRRPLPPSPRWRGPRSF